MIRYTIKLSLFIVFTFLAMIPLLAQSPCEDGTSDGFPCRSIELLSRVTPADLGAEAMNGSWLNDIWGWTDATTGKEYALVGMINGTSFVDVSDPLNPVVLGVLPEHHAASGRKEERGAGSTWRDVKVYNNHAYVVSEDLGHGMQVFDLTQLRDVQNPPVTFSETAHYSDISNAHNIVINESTGYAYAVGATNSRRCRGGGLHIIDIREPANPIYAGCYDGGGYTHDAQCVTYNGPDSGYRGKEICFNSNTDRLVIADASSKSGVVAIGVATYANVFYLHQGWLTDDHKYFVSNDELDEANTSSRTKTFIWDVQDLNNPRVIHTFQSPHRSIDHNLYVKGDHAFLSNYTTGLRILDISDVENSNVHEIGFFDTYIINNETTFNGQWSNYPFFESGNVIVSDRQSGLFVLRPDLTAGPVTSLDNDELSADVNIFPNPATTEINIQIGELNLINAMATLYDLEGKELMVTRLNVSGSAGYTMDVSGFDKGLYHLRISHQNGTLTRRISLQ